MRILGGHWDQLGGTGSTGTHWRWGTGTNWDQLGSTGTLGGQLGPTGTNGAQCWDQWGDIRWVTLGGHSWGTGTPSNPPQFVSPPPLGAVWELLLWRWPCRSALALLGTLGTLGLVARYSVVAVGAYGALAVLGVTVPIKLHRVALRALRRGQPEGEGR